MSKNEIIEKELSLFENDPQYDSPDEGMTPEVIDRYFKYFNLEYTAGKWLGMQPEREYTVRGTRENMDRMLADMESMQYSDYKYPWER